MKNTNILLIVIVIVIAFFVGDYFYWNMFLTKTNQDKPDNDNINSSDNNSSTGVKIDDTSTILKVNDDVRPKNIASSVNIRSSASSSDSSNILGQQTGGFTGMLGKITAVVKGSDGYYWYKIKLSTPIVSYILLDKPQEYGFVRSDVVVKITYFTI